MVITIAIVVGIWLVGSALAVMFMMGRDTRRWKNKQE